MAHGGKRIGAGRRVGSKAPHTIEASKAREYLVNRIVSELEPITTKHIELAKGGDRQALEYLMNQAVGKPKETVEHDVSVRLEVDF